MSGRRHVFFLVLILSFVVWQSLNRYRSLFEIDRKETYVNKPTKTGLAEHFLTNGRKRLLCTHR